MRARFIVRLHYYALYFDCQPWVYYERDRVLHLYFQGSFWQPPPHLLSKLRIGWRQHLADVRTRPAPDDHTVEGTVRQLQRRLSHESHTAPAVLGAMSAQE